MLWTHITGIGAIFSALAVALGAFAAHGLKGSLDDYSIGIFETAARYHLAHALALVALGLVASRIGGAAITFSSIAFILGILLFSGSLYTLAITGHKWLGAVTPIGGVFFILAWLSLAWAMFFPPQA